MNNALYAIKCRNIVSFNDDGRLRVTDGFAVVRDGQIDALCERAPEGLDVLDVSGMTLTPGLIDAHTHLIHAGSREHELGKKLAGATYKEILADGGGILDTVRKTRATSKDGLKSQARKSLRTMLSHGTTTVEAKSGYGLDLATEIRCLEAAAELDAEQPVDIVSTFMGAHAMPPEFQNNRRGYLDLMLRQVMPYVAVNKLAEFCDVFCEDGAFTPDETRELLVAARAMGLNLKIHADELEPMNGAELAAELAATSAEHLLHTSDTGIHAMAKAGTTAVLLPGTSFYLMTRRFARAKDMLRGGVRVALATDYNPGSCPTENLQAIMTFAAFGMGLTPEEILRGMTLNAAYAINRQHTIGNIKPGMKADLVVFDAPNLDYILYHFGVNHVHLVIKNGQTVWSAHNTNKQ